MITGWSPATSVHMAKRYAHIGPKALRTAVETISSPASSTPARNPEIASGAFDNPYDLNSDSGADVPKV
jgi:hypothetical protein